MKRTALLTTALIMAMSSWAFAEDPVYFADPNLKAAVEAELGITDPNETDMLSLIYLNASSSGIVDLTGLEYAENLTDLRLPLNQISNISAISGLTNLTYLQLSYNQINDISALSGLTNLTTLDLYDNQISDMNSVSGLTSLNSLYMGGNQLNNISAVSGLTNLTHLFLHDNQISDINEVSGLVNLTHLFLHDNQISDINGISGLINLDHLDLSDNQISDISPLSGLTNLTWLNLYNNQISDISAVGGLTNLTFLYLHKNFQITNISPITGLTNLTHLDLNINQIIDISPLSGLTNLTWLTLGQNHVSDISPLSGLFNLTNLHLDRNQINNISVVAGLTNLTGLGLWNNNISDISPLSGLTNLTSLTLHDNPLNQAAYCVILSLIENNNPGIELTYDPGECMLDCFNTRLDGIWHLRSLFTQKNGQSDNFGYDNGVFDFHNYGAFAGTMTDDMGGSWYESGISRFSEDGSINLLFSNGNTVLNEAIDVSRDVMVGNYEDDDEVGLHVFVRQGDSYAISDLEGTWYLRNLQISKNGGADDFGYDSAILTIQGDGSFAATITDETGYSWIDSGTSSIDANGIVTIIFDGWVGNPWINVMNADKDVIIGNCQDVTSFFLNVFVKKGASYLDSDLVGTWFYRSLGTQMNGQPDNFGYDNSVITIETDGSFMLIDTGTTSDENGGELTYASGTATVDPNGVVSLGFGSEPLELNPVLNAGKDVMINNYLDPNDEVGLEIFIKKAFLPGDLNHDGSVNFLDFAEFADHWLEVPD